MEILNVFRGMKKSNSDAKVVGLSERLSFGRKSKRSNGAKSIANSPLPPIPSKVISTSKCKQNVKLIENIPENLICHPSLHSHSPKCDPSLHSPRRDPDQFDFLSSQEPILIKGNKRAIEYIMTILYVNIDKTFH